MVIECSHRNQIRKVQPQSQGCVERLKTGDTWMHSRMRMTCGHGGCCDSSKNIHATQHIHESNHPIMKSLEPDETRGWCYVDQVEVDFP